MTAPEALMANLATALVGTIFEIPGIQRCLNDHVKTTVANAMAGTGSMDDAGKNFPKAHGCISQELQIAMRTNTDNPFIALLNSLASQINLTTASSVSIPCPEYTCPPVSPTSSPNGLYDPDSPSFNPTVFLNKLSHSERETFRQLLGGSSNQGPTSSFDNLDQILQQEASQNATNQEQTTQLKSLKQQLEALQAQVKATKDAAQVEREQGQQDIDAGSREEAQGREEKSAGSDISDILDVATKILPDFI